MKVFVTRAVEDFASFTKYLKPCHEAISLSCIEYRQPAGGYAEVDQAVRKNNEHEWVFFLSKRAAEIYFDRLLAIGGHLFNLAPHLKFACIGAATRDFVEKEVGFPVSFFPSVYNSDVFIKEFCAQAYPRYKFMPGESKDTIILPRTELARDSFVEQIEANAPVKVERVAAYTTACPEVDITTLKKATEVDEAFAVTFSSSQIVRNFKALSRDLDLSKAKFFSIGPKTSATLAEEFDAFEYIEAPEATMKSLAEVVK